MSNRASDRETDKFMGNVWKSLGNGALGSIGAAGAEISRLFPDSVLFGSFLLYILTQNLSYGVFSLFLFETSIFHRIFAFVFEQTYGEGDKAGACKSGFDTPRIAVARMARIQTPSPIAFFIGAVVTYTCTAIAIMKQTLDVMGPDWTSRYYFVVCMMPIISILLLVVYWSTSCFTLVEGGMTVVAGCLVGVTLFFLNQALFGPEGMNFLGLPYLVDKAGVGDPIYICSASPITAPNQ